MIKYIDDCEVCTISTQYLDIDDMEDVNKLTGLSPEHEINFIDKSIITEYPSICEFIQPERLRLLMQEKIDYIAFRLDN